MALAGEFEKEIPINGTEMPLIDMVDVRGALGPKHILVNNENLADTIVMRYYYGDADPDGTVHWAQASLDADPEVNIPGDGEDYFFVLELSGAVEMIKVTALNANPPGVTPGTVKGKLIKPPGKYTTDRG